MRTLLIDPKEKTITEHEHNGDWKTIAPTIDAYNFDVIFTDYGDIYVDDEGDSTPAFATAAELREKIRFLTVDDVREMF